MAATIRTAENLVARLNRIDSKLSRSISAYSHAAAATDRTVLAEAQGQAARLPSVEWQRRREAEALGYMLEDMQDEALTAERTEAVAALEAAGISSGIHGGWRQLKSGSHLIQMIRDLAVCRSAVRLGTSPAWGRERGAQIIETLRECGVECEAIQ